MSKSSVGLQLPLRRWCALGLLLCAGPVARSFGPGPRPGEWREFRARLAGQETAPGAGSTANEAALKWQDERLWSEYARGVWAHATSQCEPGGVLMSLPLQGQQLQDLRQRGPAHTHWTTALHDLLLPAGSAQGESESAIGRWLHDGTIQDPMALALAWKTSSSMCNRALGGMRSAPRMAVPSVHERALWKQQCAALEIRGRVCLVLSTCAEGPNDSAHDSVFEEPAEVTGLVLNKAVRTSGLTPELARRMLVGQGPEAVMRTAEVTDATILRVGNMLLEAFGDCPCYWGGPDAQQEPGCIVHGITPEAVNLPGSLEIGAGTRVYRAQGVAALEAASRAVLLGHAQPLDFRLTLGQTRLSHDAVQGEWLPVACSRPLVLKHSASLPKPLWHEVMQLCGGECAEISRLILDEENGGKVTDGKFQA